MEKSINYINELSEQILKMDAVKLKNLLLDELKFRKYMLEKDKKRYDHKKEMIHDAMDDRQIKDIVYYANEMEKAENVFKQDYIFIDTLDNAVWRYEKKENK